MHGVGTKKYCSRSECMDGSTVEMTEMMVLQLA